MAITLLPGTVQQAAAGLSGFDVNSRSSVANAYDMKMQDIISVFVIYPVQRALATGNLTNAEASKILNAGLALMAVQHVAVEGWQPSASLGTSYGSFAATYASEVVALPHGMNIWCDLEGVAPGAAATDVIAYCRTWYTAVNAAGYVPGIYVGWDTMLTPQQLYQNLSFKHYWRAYNGPQVDVRGFQLLQHTQITVNGIMIDPNISQNDNLGGSVLWLIV